MEKRYRPVHYQDYIPRLFPDICIWEGEDNRSIRTVTFKVTDDCNLRCTYCYQTCKKKKSMTFDTAKRFADYLLSSTKENNAYINQDTTVGVVFEFIGGEPLLEIDLIRKICDYLTSEMIRLKHRWLDFHRFSICTNGILYFDDRFQDFLKCYGNRTSLSITIDGNRELHDACRVFPDGRPSYDIVVKAVKHNLSFYGFTSTKVTISPENIDFLYDAIVHHNELGFRDIHANCVYEDVWDNRVHPKKFYQQLKRIADYYIRKDIVMSTYNSLFVEESFRPMEETDNQNWCGGNGRMLACDPDGELYPCIRYMETSLGTAQKPMVIGNLEDGIGGTKSCADCISRIQKVTRRSQSEDACFYCPVAEGCSWCSAYNYQIFGTLNKRATFICGMHRARALANVYFWNTYYRNKGMKERMKCFLPFERAEEIVNREEYNFLMEISKED